MNNESNNMIQLFRSPHSDYAPVVMWFWNDEITEDGITFQMEKFREQNITNLFVHPTMGCRVPYLSDRFMELIRFVVDECKRLGMYFWIYDEADWPSGTAGGILCRDYPQYRQKELRVEDRTLWPHDRVTILRPGKFVAAQLITEKNGKNFVKDVTDQCVVTRQGDYDEITYWHRGSSNTGRVLFFFNEVNRCIMPSAILRKDTDAAEGYVDILSHEAVGKFLELTHERYKQYVGDEFGKTVRGVFTDEPTTLRHFDHTTITGAWNDTFAEEFQKDHGYSIMPWLYLFWDIEPKTAEEHKAIHDYRETVKRLYFANFMGQYRNWCKENNLIFTGHFGGEEAFFHHVPQGDMLEALTLFHMPGMDTIGSSRTIHLNTFNLTPKMPSSAAKFIGSDRVLCETFSGSGWHMRFSEMKRIVNRLMLQGVNWIQFMGAFYSIGSSAKNFPYGYAPSHGYQNPFFPYYHKLGEHISSFSALSANTVPDSSVLLFMPIQQCNHERYWMQRQKCSERTLSLSLSNKYAIHIINAMVEEGIGFDLFPENFADSITVHEGYAEAFGYRYDTLIFPRMYYVNSKTKKLLAELQANHVRTLFLQTLPSLETDSGECFDSGYCMSACEGDAALYRDGAAWLFDPEEDADKNVYRAMLQTAIGTRHLSFCADEGVLITKRSNDTADVYFLCNDNDVRSAASFDALPGMRILSSDTREEAVYTVENGRVSLMLNGYEMLAILCDKQGGDLPVTTAPAAMARTTVTLEGPYDFTPADGNYLPLDYEMYDPELERWEPCRFTYFSDHLHLEPGSPYRIRSRVNMDHLPASVTLNAELTRVSRLAVNGTELQPQANVRRWSSADHTSEIAELLHMGENIIEIEGTTNDFPLLDRPPYVYLAGSFELDGENRMISPSGKLHAGDWAKAGYPRFCGVGIYKTRFTASEAYQRAFVTLHTKDIAQVYLNGIYAGQKLWVEEEVDITDFLQPGENELEVRITVTRANMFGAQCFPSEEHLSNTRTENGILQPMEIHYER